MMSFEEDNYIKYYEYSDLARNTASFDGCEDTPEVSGEFRANRRYLVAMERMVRDIACDKGSVGFEIQTEEGGKPVVKPTAKAAACGYFNSLKYFWGHCAPLLRFVYSPHVLAVIEAIEAVGLPARFQFRKPETIDPDMRKTHADIFNDVRDHVSDIVASSAFESRLRARKRNAERNEATALAVERQVFENKSRTLVLMLHFGFRSHDTTFEEIQAYRKQFFNNRRGNKLLRGIDDYIWKLEEGDESGLHMHLLIFYNAADSCRDVYIAKQIGEYWVKMTGGKGQYWNSNANKAFHEKYGHGVGTGVINWDDREKREALRINIRYMTKADQILTIKHGDSHVFGTSRVKEKKKAGRPRTVKPKLDGDPTHSVQADSLDAGSFDQAKADT
ncbi:hypothetical protein ACKI2N_015750 [Cupriavidus sp. 30B13]|uniref:hypothetical protein n=1 Tax=Cupriavidus sp. 30B13 TaxID=3384241 RepID=UPI003B8F528B